MKLSERLEKYRLVLKQLDICNAELHSVGFITDSGHRKIDDFVVDEKTRIDRALKAFGLYASADTPAPTGIPSLDAARRVTAKAASA